MSVTLQNRKKRDREEKCGPENLQKLRIATDRKGETLHVFTTPDVSKKCSEIWTLSLPTRFAFVSRSTGGRIEVSGLKGGVRIRSVAARCRLNLPGGSIDADCGVGDIEAVVQDIAYEQVSLHTGVGDTELTIHGYKLIRDRAPGAGDSLTLQGKGEYSIRLRSDVGDVNLIFGDRIP